MITDRLNDLIKRVDLLTADEQLLLAAHLVERARQSYPAAVPSRKWREIRGLAHPSLLGEDAQDWVSRSRREADRQHGNA